MSAISNLIFNGANHYMTSPFGNRNAISTAKGTTGSFHNGTDYGTKSKKLPQYAIEDGYVFAAAKASDGALYVWVIYPRIKKAFLHYHLDKISVKAGQTVKKGTKLGTTGKTGKATGIHLHLGIRDLAKLSIDSINKMTWTNLRACSYVDPEKVRYTAPVTVVYLPKYIGNYVSIVDALKSMKIDSSFTYRKKIATANGVKNYLGTSKQNTQLLNLLKKGKCVKP